MSRRKNNSNPGNVNIHTTTLDNELLTRLVSLIDQVSQIVSANKSIPKKKRRKGELKIGFYILMPHKLYVELKNYVELYGDKKESMTEIVLTGLKKELKERYARKSLFKEL